METVISVSIIDVINIDEHKESIGFRFKLSMEWKDSRVEFLNLRSNRKLNLLSKDEKHSVFYNTLNDEEEKDDNFIALTEGDLELQREEELMQYIIIKYEMKNKKSSNMIISVRLGRKTLSQILTILYLPSTIIIVVVYSTNFFKQFFFEAIVSVTLTAMLVLTTIFLGVSGDLPTSSYVKLCQVSGFSSASLFLSSMFYSTFLLIV